MAFKRTKTDREKKTFVAPKFEDGGVYLMEISDVEKSYSPAKGTPRLALHMKVAAGPLAGERLTDYIYLVESTAWKVEDFCDSIGFEGEEIVDDSPEWLLNHFQGKQLKVKLEKEMWRDDSGRFSFRIKTFYAKQPKFQAEKVSEDLPF